MDDCATGRKVGLRSASTGGGDEALEEPAGALVLVLEDLGMPLDPDEKEIGRAHV